MWWFANWCIRRAGGRPMRVTPQKPPHKPYDGLILGGGSDLDTALYGQVLQEFKENKHSREGEITRRKRLLHFVLVLVRALLKRGDPKPKIPDKARDALEWQCLHEAYERNRPVLGICRGQQLINIFFNGDLHQDLSAFYRETPEMRSLLPRKTVRLCAHTQLRDILDTCETTVNALHRQGVDRLGDGLTVSAKDFNGIIQGIESRLSDFILGVQWHPEFMPQIPRQQKLFRSLVEASQEHKLRVERRIAS